MVLSTASFGVFSLAVADMLPFSLSHHQLITVIYVSGISGGYLTSFKYAPFAHYPESDVTCMLHVGLFFNCTTPLYFEVTLTLPEPNQTGTINPYSLNLTLTDR